MEYKLFMEKVNKWVISNYPDYSQITTSDPLVFYEEVDGTTIAYCTGCTVGVHFSNGAFLNFEVKLPPHMNELKFSLIIENCVWGIK